MKVAAGQGFRPLNSSMSMKLLKKSLTGVLVLMLCSSAHFQMLYGDWIQRPTTTNQTRVTGMKIFQPRRMIWS